MKHRNIKDKHKPFIEVEIGSSNATCLYHLAYIQKKRVKLHTASPKHVKKNAFDQSPS